MLFLQGKILQFSCKEVEGIFVEIFLIICKDFKKCDIQEVFK